jgi:MFS family permease
MMATGFYTVYALRAHAALPWHVGVFTTALFGGQTAGNLVLGWVADRVGHRIVIIVGVAAAVGANGVALAAPTLASFALVFALVGVQLAALNVSWLNVLLEFAPSPDDQPTYVGLGNTALAPATLAAPLLAGVMADAVGFESMFVTAAGFGGIALAILIGRVRDPRR